MATSLDPIGFVGLGNIGFPIANFLVEAGYRVLGYDVDDDTLEKFSRIGGTPGESLEEVGRQCDVVHVAVVNEKQVRDVILGESGVLAGVDSTVETTILVHSTISPYTVQIMDDRTPAPVKILDAALSGGPARASKGDLAVMVGGDRDRYEATKPLLDTIAREVIYTGKAGSGCVVKLTHQAIWYSTISATLEALNVGQEYGVDKDVMLRAYANGTANCFFVQNYRHWMEDRPDSHEFDVDSAVNLGRKDLLTYLGLANELNVAAPTGGVVSQQYPEIMANSLHESIAERENDHEE